MVENALVLEKEIRALVEKYNLLKEENLRFKTQLEQKTSELELFIEEQEVLKKENNELRLNVKNVEGVELEYRNLIDMFKNIISTAELSDVPSRQIVENNNFDNNKSNNEVCIDKNNSDNKSNNEVCVDKNNSDNKSNNEVCIDKNNSDNKSNNEVCIDKNNSMPEAKVESEKGTQITFSNNAPQHNSQFESNNSAVETSNEIKEMHEDVKVEIRQSQDADIITINENEDPFSLASDSDWDNEIKESDNTAAVVAANNSEFVSSSDDEYIFSDDDDEDFFFGEEDEKSV